MEGTPMLHDPPADAAPDQPAPDQPARDQPAPGQPAPGQPAPGPPAADEPDVIEWGGDAFPRQRTAHRSTAPHRFHRLHQLRADRRLTPLAVTGLGLAAVFGSLVNEWATMHIRQTAESQFEPNVFSVGPFNIGMDSGYLVGILAIVALTAVASFGTPSVRRNARIAGMATGAGLLFLLVAATVSLDATLGRIYPFAPEIEVDVQYGLGLTLAYAGIAVLGLALYLAGRSDGRSPTAEPAATSAAEPAATSAAEPAAAAGTMTDDPAAAARDRRPRPERFGSEEDVRDVTVRPTAPFARPEWEDRYRP